MDDKEKEFLTVINKYKFTMDSTFSEFISKKCIPFFDVFVGWEGLGDDLKKQAENMSDKLWKCYADLSAAVRLVYDSSIQQEFLSAVKHKNSGLTVEEISCVQSKYNEMAKKLMQYASIQIRGNDAKDLLLRLKELKYVNWGNIDDSELDNLADKISDLLCAVGIWLRLAGGGMGGRPVLSYTKPENVVFGQMYKKCCHLRIYYEDRRIDALEGTLKLRTVAEVAGKCVLFLRELCQKVLDPIENQLKTVERKLRIAAGKDLGPQDPSSMLFGKVLKLVNAFQGIFGK